AVARAQQGALGGLDRGVDDLGVGAREGEVDAAELAPGQAVLLGAALPGAAAVVARVETGARPARLEGPGPAAELPHRGQQVLRIGGVEREVGGAGPLVDVEDLLPALAAVLGLVDAALGVLAPLAAERRHPRDVGVGRVEHDAADALAGLEADVGPGLAG